MSILTINYKELADNAELAFNDSKLKWTPPLNYSFLDNSLSILGSIPLISKNNKISTTETLKALKETEVSTPNGKIHGNSVLQLIRFLYFANRGALLPGSQNKHPRLATLTPLVLYAKKLHHNVMYNDWDKSDPNLKLLLGTRLESILGVTMPELTTDEMLELRKTALTFTGGKRAGEMASLVSYKCNVRAIDGIEYPQIALMIKLQIWLANASIRNTYYEGDELRSSMILDVNDWDNVPEALDYSSNLASTNLGAFSKPSKSPFW